MQRNWSERQTAVDLDAARVAIDRGESARAGRLLDEQQAALPVESSRAIRADLLLERAVAWSDFGRPGVAYSLASQAAAIYHGQRDDLGAGRCFIVRAGAVPDRAKHQWLTLLASYAAVFERERDWRWLTRCQLARCRVQVSLEPTIGPPAFLQQTATAAADHGHPELAATCLLARVELSLDRPAGGAPPVAAAADLRLARHLVSRSGAPAEPLLARADACHARLVAADGDAAGAVPWYATAVATFERHGLDLVAADVHLHLAEVQFDNGDPDGAFASVSRADGLFGRHLTGDERDDSYLRVGEALIGVGAVLEAVPVIKHTVGRRGPDDAQRRARTQLLLARARESTGDIETALMHLRAGLDALRPAAGVVQGRLLSLGAQVCPSRLVGDPVRMADCLVRLAHADARGIDASRAMAGLRAAQELYEACDLFSEAVQCATTIDRLTISDTGS